MVLSSPTSSTRHNRSISDGINVVAKTHSTNDVKDYDTNHHENSHTNKDDSFIEKHMDEVYQNAANAGWRRARVNTRFRWSLSVCVALLAVALGGPLPACLALLVCQSLVFTEIMRFGWKHIMSSRPITSSSETHHNENMDLSISRHRCMRKDTAMKLYIVYLFAASAFFSYGITLHPYLLATPWVRSTPFVLMIVQHTALVSFIMYLFGVLFFVMNLEKSYMKQQFTLLAMTIMTLVGVVFQTTIIVSTIFHGLIWIVLPILLVVSHDAFSYIFNRLFGRTPISKLSIYRTWEGYAGATAATFIIGFVLPALLALMPLMTCPRANLSLTTPTDCVPSSLFTSLASDAVIMPPYFGGISIQIAPIQFDGVVMAAFASLCAPLTGVLTATFKRVYGVQGIDEGSLYGLTSIMDRVDSQLLMGVFAAVYAESFALPSSSIDETIRVQDIVTQFNTLSDDSRLAVWAHIKQSVAV